MGHQTPVGMYDGALMLTRGASGETSMLGTSIAGWSSARRSLRGQGLTLMNIPPAGMPRVVDLVLNRTAGDAFRTGRSMADDVHAALTGADGNAHAYAAIESRLPDLAAQAHEAAGLLARSATGPKVRDVYSPPLDAAAVATRVGEGASMLRSLANGKVPDGLSTLDQGVYAARLRFQPLMLIPE